MNVVHFNKRPNKRHLLRQSLSFSNEEIAQVSPQSMVKITVYSLENSALVELNVTGEKFLSSLIDVGAKEYKIFKF